MARNIMNTPFDSYRGSDPYIFVSYSHRDAELVYRHLLWLREQGLNVWYDEGISPGSRWAEDLAIAIKGAYRFLFFVSAHSVESHHCRNEVHYATSSGVSPVVVKLEAVELPQELEFSLGRHQAINQYQYAESEFRSLLLDGIINAGQTPSSAVQSRPVAENSVAILPFSNLGRNEEDDYLSEGIAEEILHELTRIPELSVASRMAASRYKDSSLDATEIASRLKVAKVVEGSLRRIGDRVRMSVSLLNGETGYQIWSQTYDGAMSDVFEFQDEIAGKIVESLTNVLLEEKDKPSVASTRDLPAYRAYLRGTAAHRRFESDSMLEAVKFFQEAIEHDAEFFDAHFQTANCVKDIYSGENIELLELAEISLQQARRLATSKSQLVECDRVEKILPWKADFDMESLERSTRESLLDLRKQEKDSAEAFVSYAVLLVAYGLFQPALRYLNNSLRESPSAQGWFWSGCACAGQRDYRSAIEWFQLALENDRNLVLATWLRILCQNAMGLVKESRLEMDDWRISGAVDDALLNAIEINCLYWEGRIEELRDHLANTRIGRLSRAFAFFCIDELDEGVECLKPMVKKAPNQLGFLLMLESLHPAVAEKLKSSQPYQEFLERLGFTDFHRNRMRMILDSISSDTGVLL